ncbi:SapC family protein [Polaromonas sp.]|uniref:SapC family protein n=1 Tax=Polaromonas sp. TaxID=1869339 RepID=UPI003565E9A0
MTTTPEHHLLSLERHGKQRWRRLTSYAFAAQQPLLPLAGTELTQAALAMPLAFAPVDGGFACVAVVGVRAGQCLYVAPDGRWLGSYLPASLRCYPFALTPLDNDQHALCVDEASGLLSQQPQDERFFEEGGALSPTLKGILDYLGQVTASRAAVGKACAALQAHGLLQPWEISLEDAAGPRKLEGLFRVDEAALNTLPDEAFLALRHSSALVVAYAQLMSMQHLQALGALLRAHAQAEQAQTAARPLPVTPGGDLDLSFMESDTLRFT